ncbi:MAG: response regulator [Ardenticatenaceae bacterium]|nr:response regulator [Ardenticatenaceae bacterium]
MVTDPPAPSSAKILIIDDTLENRVLLIAQLRLEGYQLIEAKNGQEGIELAHVHKPELILLDVMMPGIDGFETCRRLKNDEATQFIPIIMLTALRERQYRIKGIEAGADEFLSRPHDREELSVRVRTLIRLKRARVSLEEERNRLRLLYQISRAINAQLDLESTMSEVITQTQRALGATKGNIILLDEQGEVTHKFMIRAGSTLEISDQITRDVMSRGLGGWLVKHNQADIIHDINKDDRWVTLPDHQQETGSAIGVPLSNANRVVGILILNHPDTNYFTNEHLELLNSIAAQATISIENASLFTIARDERHRLEAILSQSTDAIITTDETWCISRLNQAAERFFDLDAISLVGVSIRQVPQLRAIVPLFESASRVPQAQEVNLNGDRILFASVSPIQDVGFVAVMQDVTEFKRAEEMKLEAERQEKQRVKNMFSSYMGPRLVEHVLSHEPGLMARRELRESAVVMFVDIRNWTGGMMTKVSPDVAIQQLNEFFTNMMDIALENDGTVFELTGDEMLVGFNAPFDQKDAPVRAVRTAVTMQQTFNELRQEWFARMGTELGLGIGINLGDVVMGNVGAETRMSFRMVGEAMNTAARLVDLAEDGQIVISKAVYEALLKLETDLLSEVAFHTMQPVLLKGIKNHQQLYLVQITRPPLT